MGQVYIEVDYDFMVRNFFDVHKCAFKTFELGTFFLLTAGLGKRFG